MALTLRPTGLESPGYNDLKDYTVFSGRWGIGRIYEERGARPDLRWYWTLYGPHAGLDIIRRDGRASTLEEAKAQLAENWRNPVIRRCHHNGVPQFRGPMRWTTS